MKKIYFFFIAFSFSFFMCSAINHIENEDALLWKIYGNGLEQPSFLLGTHHKVCATFLDSIPGLFEAFDLSEQFVSEIVPEEYQLYVQRSSYLPADSTYEKLLSEEDYLLLNEKIDYFFKGAENLKSVKPAVLLFLMQQQLSQIILAELDISFQTLLNPPCEKEYIDYYLMRLAKENEYSFIGLDEEEDAFFNLKPISTDLEQLKLIIHATDSVLSLDQNIKKELAEIIVNTYQNAEKCYKTRKLEEFQRYLDSSKELVTGNQYLMQQVELAGHYRNARWMKKIPVLISEKPSFIAVGAAHLIGDSGLIHQLKLLGYAVEPVK